MNMDYTMEDTQNSAPGEPTVREAAKLSSPPRRTDAQSVTKRSAAMRATILTLTLEHTCLINTRPLLTS